MLVNLLSILILVAIPTLVLLIAWVMAMKTHADREKTSPFECGFDPKSSARIPFSTRFFLLAVLFLIFDIEIVLLLPLPYLTAWNPQLLIFLTALILILLLGTLHEWREGSLNWTK